MRIVTWNINSLRLRLPLVERLVGALNPDVLCLQETKVEDGLFPHEALAALGFAHRAVVGMKGYNGVAILSRLPLGATTAKRWCGRKDARHLAVRLPGDIELHNFYVPAGGDIPDPAANDKFAHKLSFVEEAARWWARQKQRGARRVLVGDLNIAPLEHDVWSHKQLLDVVSHTPAEVERFARWQESQGWVDAVRHFVPADQKLYSWWSYRAHDWVASNRGRRLDHIWVSPVLQPSLERAIVLREARGWPQPSDHVPVSIDLAAD